MKSENVTLSWYKKLNEFAYMNKIAITDIIEKMDNTARISNTTIYQLCQAILEIGATAAYMPGGATRCIEVLGVFANHGINGKEAGLHLKVILLSLLAPGKDAKKLMNQLNISEIDTNGELKDFSEFFPELRKVIEKMSIKQKMDILLTLFSAQRIVPAMILCYGIAPEKRR